MELLAEIALVRNADTGCDIEYLTIRLVHYDAVGLLQSQYPAERGEALLDNRGKEI